MLSSLLCSTSQINDGRSSPNISEQLPNASSPIHLSIIVTPASAYYIMYIYVATSESVLALGFLRGLPLVHTLLTVSKRLHEQMLSAVLRAPMAVLNTMKTGQSLSYCSFAMFFKAFCLVCFTMLLFTCCHTNVVIHHNFSLLCYLLVLFQAGS